MPRTLRTIEGASALQALGVAYDELCVRTGVPVTGRRPWLQAWIECYPHWTPLVVVVEDGGRLVAAAPLATRRRAHVVRVVGLGTGPTDELHLPADDEDAAARLAGGVRELLAARTPWTLHLRQLPPASGAVLALLRELPGAALRYGEGLPQVRIDERDPRRYMSKNLRKAQSKALRRLHEDGVPVEVRWEDDPQAIRALLPRLAAVRRRRDVAVRGRSDHSDARAARFFEHVLQVHAQRGELLVATMLLGGELAAYSCNLLDGSALRIWDARVDPRWTGYSAGRLVTWEVLLRVVADPGLDLLDWMQGEEPYKLQTATTVVAAVDLLAASSWGLRAAGAGVEALRTAKRRSAALSRLWWTLQDRRSRASGGTHG